MLSIIIPLRNEIDNLENIKDNFDKNLKDIKFEVILINDFSSDGTFQKANDIAKQSANLKEGFGGCNKFRN